MKNRRSKYISPIVFVILAISIVGIFYLIVNHFRKRKIREYVIGIYPKIEEGLEEYALLTNYERYFCNLQRTSYETAYRCVSEKIPTEFTWIGLSKIQTENIKTFIEILRKLESNRADYNRHFVLKEQQVYSVFFAQLDVNPLSSDQTAAIICDEDNNLIIAGAGTGKTTTIAGKVAYLLEKGLATSEEILVISFTKNAVEEMSKRITTYCKSPEMTEGLTIKTFNSYGNEVVRRLYKEKKLNLAFEGQDDLLKIFFQNTFDELFLNDKEFRRKAVNFLAFFNRPSRDEFSFKTGDDFYKHERSFKNKSLDGKNLKSKEEVEIANFLFLNSIEYEYERDFELKPEDINYRYGHYKPDFYLTNYKIWIEHFGINREGNVPGWFAGAHGLSAKDYYLQSMKWKEYIHTTYGTTLIKTYSYENREGSLIKSLKEKLKSAEVEFKPKSSQEILDAFKDNDTFNDFNKLIVGFLNLMKSNNQSPDTIETRNKNDKRLIVFIDVFRPLFSAYENHVRLKKLLDFNDMINYASKGISNNHYQHPFKYVLIDEFQDMSIGRYELLRAIKAQNPATKLYCVGDDWQSIFRFSGSDISIITEFKDYFGYTKTSNVLNTYRFNQEILKVTNDFIQRNDAQLKKELQSQITSDEPSFKLIALNFYGLTAVEKRARTNNKVKEILRELNNRHEFERTQVFLIGRYNHNKPEGVHQFEKDFPNLSVEFYTAHSVKGLTSDFSILIDVNSGVLGFPSEMMDDPILEYLLHEGDHFENAEERRLFYVAITRARHKNFLIYDELNESKFISELRKDLEITQDLIDSQNCPLCQGLMVLRNGNNGTKFWGCSHYPYCNGNLKYQDMATTPI